LWFHQKFYFQHQHRNLVLLAALLFERSFRTQNFSPAVDFAIEIVPGSFDFEIDSEID
jgi:hypothetical protein